MFVAKTVYRKEKYWTQRNDGEGNIGNASPPKMKENDPKNNQTNFSRKGEAEAGHQARVEGFNSDTNPNKFKLRKYI